MGMDLQLLPFWNDDPASEMVLSVHRQNDLFAAIRARRSHALSHTLYAYVSTGAQGEPRYGRITHDAYGQPLKYVDASQLTPLRNHPAVQASVRNRAIWAFLDICNAKVVLYWN